jgi:hypothetical protein
MSDEPFAGSPTGKAGRVYVWPCGCVTRDARNGPLVKDCGGEHCYRRRQANRAVPIRRAFP